MTIETEEQARAYVETQCDAPTLKRLERLAEMLCNENTRQNLVAKASLSRLWLRHIADSAQLLSHVPSDQEGPWLDLGTGAGFPGLVIAAMRPELDVRLVESRKRRVEWLEQVRTDLGLPKCQVVGARLEMVEAFPAGVISARAFAPMPRLIELSARFSTKQTLWLLPKGRSAAQDLASLPDSLAEGFHVEQSLTDRDAGIIVGTLKQQ